jgi:type I restriction enzyme S subunit
MNAQQLRNSILQQAIQGKLVPQDPADEPASVLLQRIRKEKEQLVKEGKLKKKDLESKPIEEDEIPFEIPESWEWCRVADVIFPPKYGTSNKSLIEGAVPVLRMGNIQDGEIVFDKLVYSNNLTDNEKYNLKTGDLLFNRTNSAELVGKTGIYRGQQQAIYAGYLILLRPIEINSGYLNFVLGSSYAHSYCQEVKTIGVQQCNINAEKISSFCIPLPPLAEQRRIVAKIEELMPLVERYGKAQQALDQLNESLPARLRQSILQEAIQGRLVPQDPKEEPVDSLLAEIKNKKEQLWQRQEIKKNSLLSIPIEDDEVEYSIPDSWRYVRLQDVCTCIFSGKSPKYSQTPTIHKIIGQQSNQWNGVEMRFVKYGTEEFAKSISQIQYLQDHDVLLNTLGNGTLGRSGIYYTSYSETPVLTDGHIFVLRTLYEATAKYILAYLRVKFVDINRSADGSTNQTFLNLTKTAKWIIPLPPLSEQKRIVAKVEELFGVIKK